MAVVRTRQGTALATVVLRHVDGKDRWDQRLGTAVFDCPPGSDESIYWPAALEAAAEALRKAQPPR
jgi:hypothetical protein